MYWNLYLHSFGQSDIYNYSDQYLDQNDQLQLSFLSHFKISVHMCVEENWGKQVEQN